MLVNEHPRFVLVPFSLLQDVGLLKKSEERVKNLSGGMKRKLSVAMAFVGHSTIIILDEPTSGVDPHARRAIWNLIMKQKTGKYSKLVFVAPLYKGHL